MNRAFKTRYFSRWARKVGLIDTLLCRALKEMQAGLIDATLAKGVVKKRVALPGRGKRGSTRTIVATNTKDRWFFVFGYEKNDRENITDDERETLKDLADDLLGLTDTQLDAAVEADRLEEICHDE